MATTEARPISRTCPWCGTHYSLLFYYYSRDYCSSQCQGEAGRLPREDSPLYRAQVRRELGDDWQGKIAKQWAKRQGYQPAWGGWVRDQRGQLVCQGYGELYALKWREIAGWLTRSLTGASSFPDLLGEVGTSYRPTLLGRNFRERVLAQMYDIAQRERGDARRAFRGSRVGLRI